MTTTEPDRGALSGIASAATFLIGTAGRFSGFLVTGRAAARPARR